MPIAFKHGWKDPDITTVESRKLEPSGEIEKGSSYRKFELPGSDNKWTEIKKNDDHLHFYSCNVHFNSIYCYLITSEMKSLFLIIFKNEKQCRCALHTMHAAVQGTPATYWHFKERVKRQSLNWRNGDEI